MVRIYGVTQTNSGGSGSGSGNAPGLQLTAMTQSNSSSFFTTDGFGIENNANILIIPANKSALFTIQIVANTEASPHKSASWQISGLAKRNTEQSSIMIVGLFPVSSTSDSEMATSKVELSENYAYGGISIRCYGVFNYTVINWAATVTLTEV